MNSSELGLCMNLEGALLVAVILGTGLVDALPNRSEKGDDTLRELWIAKSQDKLPQLVS